MAMSKEDAQAQFDKLTELLFIENTDMAAEIFTFEQVITSVKLSKVYINASKSQFKEGGYVLDSVPLASKEFEDCLTNIDKTVTAVENLINDLEKKIKDNKDKINQTHYTYFGVQYFKE